MRPDEADPAHLWDIAGAARNILAFTSSVGLDAYLEDMMMQRAVERELEIMGEAARRLSPAYRAAHPEVPWRGIIAQRNVLAHEYGEIQHDLIWRLVSDRIPPLLAELERLLAGEPADG